MSDDSRDELVLVDGHAHIHRNVGLPGLFDQVHDNFREIRVAGGLRHGPNVLLLAEGDEPLVFRTLTSRNRFGGWRTRPTRQGDAVVLSRYADGREAAQRIVVVTGRQLHSRERLEVLSFGSVWTCPENASFSVLLEHAVASDALTVIPWGFGKWWFRRGRLVAAALEGYEPGELLVGDSRLRPRGAPPSRVMVAARRRGFGLVAGTDPLPLARERSTIGRYVSVLSTSFSYDRPAEGIISALSRPGVGWKVAGARCSWLQSARAQLDLRLSRIGARRSQPRRPELKIPSA